jgi:hypothetical protein
MEGFSYLINCAIWFRDLVLVTRLLCQVRRRANALGGIS